MLDGVHAGFERGSDAVAADGVSGDFFADAMRFLDDGFGFLVGEIDVAVQHAIGPVEIAAIGVILDPVRTEHDLFANRFAGFVHAVDILHAGGNLEFPGITKEGIHTCGSHGPGRDLHVRARNFPVGDGLLHVHVGVHRPFGFEVA